MGMNDLKPCPFCGGKPEIEDYTVDEPVTCFDFGFRVYCTKCNTKFSKSTRYLPGLHPEEDAKTIRALAERWNRRDGGQP